MRNKEHNKNVCLICGSELGSEPLVRFWNMPSSAQGLPAKDELAEDKGINLDLYSCPSCGLVQFDCEPVEYYRDVIRAVGLSDTMKELRRADYRHMIEKYGLEGGKWIECGCGNGDFLAVLREFPVHIYGTEANKANAELAQKKLEETAARLSLENGREWIRDYSNTILNTFPEDKDMELEGAPFDCFLSFNFLEHQPDPVTMLRCMSNNLRDGGYGIISVPAFEYILKDGNYYEFIRDHIANYSMASLKRLCELCGFEVLEEGFIGIGDTLLCVVRKPENVSRMSDIDVRENDSNMSDIDASCASSEMVAEEISELNDKIRNSFKKNYELKVEAMKAYIEELRASGRTLSLWGAGHQGLTIAATTKLSEYASYIIDSADFKQGKYAPASHIPIVSPEYAHEHPTDVIMIAAPGYIKEIEKNIRARFGDIEGLRICDVLSLNER